MSERRFIEIGSDLGNRVRLLGHQASPEAVLPHKPKGEIVRQQPADFMDHQITFNSAPEN